MTRGRVADGLDAGIEQHAQHRSPVVRRAANDEPVHGIAPGLAQPVEVRLETAGRHHHGAGVDTDSVSVDADLHRPAGRAVDVQPHHLGVVGDVQAQAVGQRVVRVEQRLAAAQEEEIRPFQVQRATKRRLKAHPASAHPRAAGRRLANGQAGQRLVDLGTRHAPQVVEELALRIRLGEIRRRRPVRAAQVARVPAVAAAIVPRRGLHHQDAGAPLAGRQRGAQRRVPATNDHDVVGRLHVPMPRLNRRPGARRASTPPR